MKEYALSLALLSRKLLAKDLRALIGEALRPHPPAPKISLRFLKKRASDEYNTTYIELPHASLLELEDQALALERAVDLRILTRHIRSVGGEVVVMVGVFYDTVTCTVN